MKNLFRISGVMLFVLSIFLIHSCKKDKPTSPIITTTAISVITQTTATSGGNITNDGGASITVRGVCWSTTTGPTTILNTKTTDGTGTGAFASSITGLASSTIYYVKAYATNSAGTAYGNEISFTTTAITGVVPSITTSSISAITAFTASCGGNITSEGTATVTARGICWSTDPTPTLSNSITFDGAGAGIYSSALSGLNGGTTYYVRAYATNSVGTGYGMAMSFITLGQVPTVTTLAATVITTVAAQFNGSVNANYLSTVVTFEYGTTTSYGSTIIATQSPLTGSTNTNVIANITGLTAATIYHYRIKAVNSLGTTYGADITFTTTLIGIPGTLSDNDGNTYQTISIGYQVWMAENLKTTKYSDGTAIPNVTVDATWAALTTGAYSDYSNTPANSTTYGRLYNWFVVDNNAATKVASNGGKNVCPTSWHVPTDAELTTLTTYLGGEVVAGGKLKETGTTHWLTPNTGATNETGFTVLPGGGRGGRGSDGTYDFIGYFGYWWSSTEYSATSAWYRSMHYNNSTVGRNDFNKQFGFSVRCLRDF